ncbi:MAG: C39 family peptidase [Deltaproteobacteria bacterium]|jgi:predicted double-glycine peptidase|nr:C39 family peptidase [Deltaproteobacteria bacterium]
MHIPKAIRLFVIVGLLASLFCGCFFSKPLPEPFNVPTDSRLVLGMPFIPDDSNLCGPASLAAVLTYSGYPTTLEEVTQGVQRWDIKGSIGPDLVLWARSKGAKARFYSAVPEDLIEFVNKQIPVIVQVDQGVGPIIKGHFMVVVGYTYDGVVVNSGLVQQEIIDWATFLTDWYAMGNFTAVVEPKYAQEDEAIATNVATEGQISGRPVDSLMDFSGTEGQDSSKKNPTGELPPVIRPQDEPQAMPAVLPED